MKVGTSEIFYVISQIQEIGKITVIFNRWNKQAYERVLKRGAERNGFELLKSDFGHGFFRFLYKTKYARYTFWSNVGRSRLNLLSVYWQETNTRRERETAIL